MSPYLSLQVLTALLRLGLGLASCHMLARPGPVVDRAQAQTVPSCLLPAPSSNTLLPSLLLHPPLLSSLLFHLCSLSAPLPSSLIFPSVFPAFSSPHCSILFSFLLFSSVLFSLTFPPLPPFSPPLFSLPSTPPSLLYQDFTESL